MGGEPTSLERAVNECIQLKHCITRCSPSALGDARERVQQVEKGVAMELREQFVKGLQEGDTSAVTECLRCHSLMEAHEQAYGLVRQLLVRPGLQKIMQESQVGSRELDGAALEALFSQIVKFIEKGCAVLHTPAPEDFEFVTRAIWPEVVSIVLSQLRSLHQAAVPTLFHSRYLAVLRLAKEIGGFCGSGAALSRFQRSAEYRTFMEKFNLDLYHLLVRKELIVRVADEFAGHILTLEEGDSAQPMVLQSPALALSASAGEGAGGEDTPFANPAFTTLYNICVQCFAKETYLPGLAAEFLELWVQLISFARNAVQREVEKEKLGLTLHGLSIFHDVQVLSESLAALRPSILAAVVDDFSSEHQGVQELVERTVKGAVEELNELHARLTSHFSSLISKQCVHALQPLLGVAQTYRLMPNKAPPVHPSYYVDSIFTPWKEFQRCVAIYS